MIFGRSLSLSFKNLQEGLRQLWSSDRSRQALDWVAYRLEQADSRIREFRRARPNAFWVALLSITLFPIVVAIFISGGATWVWAKYSSERENIAPLATFVGAAIAAYAVLSQAAIASRRHYAQTEADRQRRIIESFGKAIEQLGSDKLEVRVGAIFSLERLSRESDDDYWSIMQVLAASVRDRMRYTTIVDRLSKRAYSLWEQAGRPDGRSEDFWRDAVRLEGLEGTPTDLDAVLTVIKRRDEKNRQREGEKGWRFDLRGTYLMKAALNGVHLENALLDGAHLEGASLWGAELGGASLPGAHLEGAYLSSANLKGANLFGAQLQNAYLGGADLQAFLKGANLEGANL
jgi:hypothetical protein